MGKWALDVSVYSQEIYQVNRGKPGMLASDLMAVEEPLEIRVERGPVSKREKHTLSITMRTPGNDAELAQGFLFTEGIIRDRRDVESAKPCGPVTEDGYQNIIRVLLSPSARFDIESLKRNFYTTSSCGICGKTSLEAVEQVSPFPTPPLPAWKEDQLLNLVSQLEAHQGLFQKTGGIHACALFDQNAKLLAVREDVGRHNALDKLIGWAFTEKLLPLNQHLVLFSGRASFELVQKAVMAGIPAMAAVGAPSSLAIKLAAKEKRALVGFLKPHRFNVYCGQEFLEKNNET